MSEWARLWPSAAVEMPSSLGGRILASVIVVVVAHVFARFVVPTLTRHSRRLVSRVVVRGPIEDRVDRLAALAPWWVTEGLLVQIAQALLAILTVFFVLVVWGQSDIVLGALMRLSLSVPILGQIGATIALFVLAWIGVDVLDSWLDRMTERSEQFTRHQEEITFRVLQIALFTAVSLAALSMWGIDLSGMLVGAGFLGIVVGIAAQQTLGSLLAGFVLMFSRPFEIGDWVEIGQEEGIVTDITVVNTRVENFNGEYVVLPNDTVSNSTIINRSRKGRLRLVVEVGIDYEADPDHAEDVAVDALSEVDELLTVPRPMVVTSRLADSAVILELRFWIDKPSARRRARATSAAIHSVKAAFEREGIKIPFPQRELSGRAETAGFRVVDARADDRE